MLIIIFIIASRSKERKRSQIPRHWRSRLRASDGGVERVGMTLMITKRSCVALALVLQLLSGVFARSSVFARNGDDRHGVAAHQAETDPEMLPSPKHPRTLSERAQEEIKSREQEEEEDGNQMGVSKIGSSPPSCEHKCYGCTPCEATQVPATRDGDGHAHVRVQYTNYEPEDWKCKCGPSLYTP